MESKFDGGILGMIGVGLVVILVSFITLGIATPWMVCYQQRWITNHTVVDGKRLSFEGTGGELFGKYLLWLLLTIITFGIYSLWVSINMKRWITKHTHFAN